MRLADASVAWPTPATSTLTLRLEVERGIEWAKLDLDPLTVYFGEDPAVATPLRLFLALHVAGVTVRAGGGSHELPASAVRLDVGDGVLPGGTPIFPGFRLLQEYFAFRRRFAFLDIVGLDALGLPAEERTIEIELRFSRPLPHEIPISTERLRLYCSPAINLFEENAEPIRAEHRQTDYSVRADAQRPRSVEVFEVLGVDGIEDSGARHAYASYHTFSWPSGRFFEEVTRGGPDGRRQTYVAVGGDGDAGPTALSVAVRCLNGDLPHDALPEGTLSKAPPGVPNVANFRNLGRPTRAQRPPLDAGQGFLWHLVAYLAMNRASIATPAALGALLALHDWSGDPANARRVQSIRHVAWRPAEALHRGGIIRGAEVAVDVEDDAWVDEGDLHLFGTVLSAVLADYATINSFVHLDLTARPSGRHFRWTPRTGTQPLL
jgi:type VI secretion system protein ImpG